MSSGAPKRAVACKWLPDHIKKMLESLKDNKAALGQGSNPTKTHYQDAATAVNMAFGDTQNKDKTLTNVADKWRALCSIYIGLLAWDKKSSVSYDNTEFGCGVTLETQAKWNLHLVEHKTLGPHANKPWQWFSEMQAICDASVKAKGSNIFMPHNTPAFKSQPSADAAPANLDKEDIPFDNDIEHAKVVYSSDEDVSISDKPTCMPGMLTAKRQAPEDKTLSASQTKRARSSAKEALTSAGLGLESLLKVLEKGFNALIPSAPSTPSCTGRGMSSTTTAVELSPVLAQNAITQASILELDHLKDLMLVMKFIYFLEENEKAIITYNTLVKAANAQLREAYVKECIHKYEAAEGRKDLGL